MNYYVTFGQSHAHGLNGKVFDKDCVAVIEVDNYIAAREIAFDAFGTKWAFIYEDKPNMEYYPRGLITLQDTPTPADVVVAGKTLAPEPDDIVCGPPDSAGAYIVARKVK